MSTFDQTLFYIGFGASVFFVGQLILMFVGGDTDGNGVDGDFGDAGDADGDGDFDEASSFKMLTLKNIIGFCMGLGWGGLSLHIDGGFSKAITYVFAPLIGVGVMFIQSLVFYLMYQLHAPNEESLDDAIGKNGTVYLGIDGVGVGKVTVSINGRLTTMDARSEDGSSIETNTKIVVSDVSNAELIVKELRVVDLNTSASK